MARIVCTWTRRAASSLVRIAVRRDVQAIEGTTNITPLASHRFSINLVHQSTLSSSHDIGNDRFAIGPYPLEILSLAANARLQFIIGRSRWVQVVLSSGSSQILGPPAQLRHPRYMYFSVFVLQLTNPNPKVFTQNVSFMMQTWTCVLNVRLYLTMSPRNFIPPQRLTGH